jgi:hypothetical protein
MNPVVRRPNVNRRGSHNLYLRKPKIDESFRSQTLLRASLARTRRCHLGPGAARMDFQSELKLNAKANRTSERFRLP